MNNKQIMIVISLASILLMAAGCRKDTAQKPKPVEPSPKLWLPDEVAGTWQARESPWRITVDPNGTITSVLLPMGNVMVRPNHVTRVEMKDGSWSTYAAGDFDLEYSPSDRTLFVTVVMEDIDIVFMQNQIKGHSTDRFVGRVSQDGQMWTADWITQFDYGPRFPQDPNDVYAEMLVFEKVETEPRDLGIEPVDPNEAEATE